MKAMDSPASPANDEREGVVDKLTQIDGIASKTAQVLYEVGLRSYSDLVAYLRHHSTEEISQTLKEHGLNRPPGFIKTDAWIRQAELFSLAEKSATSIPAKEAKSVKDTIQAQPDSESPDHDAVFTVLFDIVKDANGEARLQTTVYDEKNGGKEMVFSEGDLSGWVDWMLHQANLPLVVSPIEPTSKVSLQPDQTQTEETAPTSSTASQISEQVTREEVAASKPQPPSRPVNATVDIHQIQVFIAAPRQETAEKLLKAEVIFKLSGADAEALANHRQSYRIEIYSIEYDRGAPAFVAAEEGRLQPNTDEYKHQLSFAMPPVGRYELHSMVRLPASGEMKGYYMGPTLRITP